MAMFLTNMPKIQKKHFFSRTIYIIIKGDKGRVCPEMHRFGRVIRGQTRLNMKKPQQSAPVRAEMVSENPGNGGK